MTFFARDRFIGKLIGSNRDKREQTLSPPNPIPQRTTSTETDEHDVTLVGDRRRNFVRWIQPDGVFLLRLLQTHAGERLTMKCLADLIQIWVNNYEDKSRLAERLLRNQFEFSK